MGLHFKIYQDFAVVQIKKEKNTLKYKIKRENLSEELFSIIKKAKVQLRDIKKVTIKKSKNASQLNIRIAGLFKRSILLFRKV